MRTWEEGLRKSQERLFEDQRLLNQREDKANERDRTLHQKENDLDEAQKEIDRAKLNLKEREADIITRLTALVSKEKVSFLIYLIFAYNWIFTIKKGMAGSAPRNFSSSHTT